MKLRRASLALFVALWPLVDPAATALAQTSAAERARHAGEIRRIEARFAARVANIVGLPEQAIVELLPQEPRISDRGRWLAEAIGARYRPLGEPERQGIMTADRERRAALAALRQD